MRGYKLMLKRFNFRKYSNEAIIRFPQPIRKRESYRCVLDS